MKKSVYLLLVSLLVLVACTPKTTVTYTVASKAGNCIGEAPQTCLLVKKGTAKDWSFFYDNIEGFKYEEGYEYVLEVSEEKLEDVPADASAIKYVLVKEVSKTATTSANLPQEPKDIHSAKNSLDFKGTYKGVLPTASGEGMDVTIQLADSTFTKSVLYVGKKAPAVVEKGAYSWNAEGTTITLAGIKNAPSQYFVGENILIQLDMDGKVIEGDLAKDYRLGKVIE